MALTGEQAYALSQGYTNKSIKGISGTLAGKNATIESIIDIAGGHRVTFKWTADNGDVRTQSMDVMDGTDGQDGKGIKAVAVNSSNHLIITYDDDTTVDAGEIDIHSAVNSVNGKTGNVNLTASDVGALPDDTSIPSKTSDLTNDSIVDSASYDSTNHQILFKNGATTLFSLDAAAFVKDGMVDDVEISGGSLVITFNTDAGKQAISIPLTDIFDPANYYDKDDVDELLADKADKTDVDSAIAGQQSLLKDTVGWTGKNLLKNQGFSRTLSGLTYVYNTDGSVTVNGTATANTYVQIKTLVDINPVPVEGIPVILSGAPAGSAANKYWLYVKYRNADDTAYEKTYEDYGNGIEFTIPSGRKWEVYTAILNGQTVNNLTFYPMLRKADITDPTYEPYHESVEVMYEEEIHGVNLLKVNATSKTIDGITYTFNPNNSVTLNGTSTRAYAQYDLAYRYIATFTGMVRLNGGLSANIHLYPWDLTRGARPYKDSSKTELQTGIQYNSNGDILFYVEKGNSYAVNPRVAENGTTVSNATMYPMLRKADIEDSTYRPYNEQAIQNQLNAQGVLGAKNLISYPYYHTTRTEKGIAWTVNGDGTVTANGTATELSQFMLHTRAVGELNDMVVPNGRYVFTGCPKGGTSSTYRVIMGCTKSNAYYSLGEEYGDGVEIVLNGDDFSANSVSLQIALEVRSGQTVNNLVFKPMLRLASDPDNTYQPYAMTNRELTENKLDKTSTVLTSSNNLDDVRTTGIYYWKDSIPTNTPENITYAMMEVVKHGDNVTHQIIKKGEAQYQRIYSGNPLAWKSWYKFTGTVIS